MQTQITNKHKTLYSVLFSLVLSIGLACGYFLFRDNTIDAIHIYTDFNIIFSDFFRVIKILIFQFIFGFSIISAPVCFVILLNQSLIYGYSIYFILNFLNRTDLTIFYIIIYLSILSVYTLASVTSAMYTKTLLSASPDIKEIFKLDSTHKYIKKYIIFSGVLLLLQVIKICYMVLFY